MYEATQQGPTAALAWRGPTLYVETDGIETRSAGSVTLSANGNTVAWNAHVQETEEQEESRRGCVQVYQRQLSIGQSRIDAERCMGTKG